jgi:hypothetical protein
VRVVWKIRQFRDPNDRAEAISAGVVLDNGLLPGTGRSCSSPLRIQSAQRTSYLSDCA